MDRQLEYSSMFVREGTCSLDDTEIFIFTKFWFYNVNEERLSVIFRISSTERVGYEFAHINDPGS